MAQRRHHYERAFENYLRSRRIPYIAVDEAKKTLLPERAHLRVESDSGDAGLTLKSFDFVIYGERCNFLVDVKGRRVPRNHPTASKLASAAGNPALPTTSLITAFVSK